VGLGFSDLVDIASTGAHTQGQVAEPLVALLIQVHSLRAAHTWEERIAQDLEALEDSVRRVLRHARAVSAQPDARNVNPIRAGLSSRELHVLKQVAAGLSNKQIARRLGISEKTVRNHLTRVFSKLGATNRTEAVVSAMRTGLVSA